MRKSPFLIVGFAALAAAQTPRSGLDACRRRLAPASQRAAARRTDSAGPQSADVRRASRRRGKSARHGHRQLDRPAAASGANQRSRATMRLLGRYPVFAMATADVIRDYNLVQQLQRKAKKLDDADSSMNKAQARREVLRQDPQTAELVRKTQQFVGQIQSAQLARAVTSESPARRSDGRLLGESLQRLRRQGTDATLPHAVRPRRHSPQRAREIPRPARRGREESGDAVLPRQLPERGRLRASDARAGEQSASWRASSAAWGRWYRRASPGA